MRITRRQIRRLLKETDDAAGEIASVENLLSRADPVSIRQAFALCQASDLNFKQIVSDMVEKADLVSRREVDNVIYQIDDHLLNSYAMILNMMGIDHPAYNRAAVIHEDDIADVDSTLIFVVKTAAQAAINAAVVDYIMAIAENKR